MSQETASLAQTRAAPIVPPKRKVDRDFALLWTGQSVSLFGDQCMMLTLPLITVEALGGTAAQAALLSFALYLPILVLGLPAGVMLERFSRRSTLITCNVVQMGVFAAIGSLLFFHVLAFWMLFAAVLCAGVAVVFFQVAYSSYMPCLYTDPDDLHKGNSRLALSDSLSRAVGPASAGLLLGAIGAVGIIVANAASFALAAGSLLLISQRDFPEQRATVRRSLWREVGAGLQFVWSHPVLQPVMLCGTSYMFFLSALEASLVLYCHDSLGLSASLTGVVVGAAAAGYPIGNIYSRKAVHRLGILRALVGTAALSVTGLIAMPVLGSLGGIVGAAGLILGSVVHSAGEGAYGPTSLTLRQTVTPPELLKRISAVQRFMLWGAMAAGGLLASAIISCFSLSLAVWVGALGTAVCLPLLIRRDVRRAFMPGVTFELERKP